MDASLGAILVAAAVLWPKQYYATAPIALCIRTSILGQLPGADVREYQSGATEPRRIPM